MRTTELTFHVIYTPGTVAYLSPFVSSLLKWSDCSFRLVANGCRAEENESLRELCRCDPGRLEFLALPFRGLIEHGRALSYLRSLERSDHFCFMDSDILATGDFMSDIASHLGRYAGIFSGTPLWCRDEEQILPETFPFMPGRYNRTDKGVYLGTTFFALYDNRLLSQVIQSTGIAFDSYSWPHIPAPCQKQLTRMGLAKWGYDPGKLLNLLLLAQGEQLLHVDIPHLHHIGGISAYLDHRRRSNLARRVFYRLRGVGRQIVGSVGVERRNGAGPVVRHLMRRKDRMDRYFLRLLSALLDHQPLPAIPNLDDAEIEARVQRVTGHILDLYQELHVELPGRLEGE